MTVSQAINDPGSESDRILEVRGVNVAFEQERGQARVINDVSIDIEREEILGIVGESGSGKSMFAAALLDAVVEPGVTVGDITYYPEDGKPVDVLGLSEKELRKFRWEEVAMVFQGAMSSFNPVQTIEAHFIETLSAHDYRVSTGLERAREFLSDLHLDPERVLSSYPHELSGGMTQRALIALSLILEPKVVVMDEPTAALDLLMQRSIISLIRSLKERYNLTILFITHDLPLVAGLADRVAVMYSFEFVEAGPSNAVLSDPAHPYTRSLLNSTPNISAPIDQMKPIEGSSPDPVNPPRGCSFHPRCPLATEQCVEVNPHPYEIDEDHTANCHFWQDARETMPAVSEPIDEELVEISDEESELRPRSEQPVIAMNEINVHFEIDTGGLFTFFSDPKVVRAVDGVSLDVFEDEVVVLVGESGCGKTTLGKTAIGLIRPSNGDIEFKGQDLWEARDLVGDISIPYEDIKKSLQIIHQDPGSALNDYHKIRTILETPIKRAHPELDGADRKERILGMLEYVGMSPAEDYISRYPFQLSGGEQQRIALIRALLMNPDVILADEAVSALDVSLRIEIMDLMLRLQDAFGTSYVFVSHNMSDARYMAKKSEGRIGVMYLGKLVETGRPDQVIHDPRHPYTKALRWATPELGGNITPDDEMPLRGIDIPDPANPPSGCRFHTRCPEAREICREVTPELRHVEGGGEFRQAACFREDQDHRYWDSEPLVDSGDNRPNTN